MLPVKVKFSEISNILVQTFSLIGGYQVTTGKEKLGRSSQALADVQTASSSIYTVSWA